MASLLQWLLLGLMRMMRKHINRLSRGTEALFVKDILLEEDTYWRFLARELQSLLRVAPGFKSSLLCRRLNVTITNVYRVCLLSAVNATKTGETGLLKV